MRYGKIRIEDGYLIFTKHMMVNNLPCKDILWAYMRREGMDGVQERQLSSNYLVVVTRRRKRYKFDMTEREVQDCIRLLKVLNPDMAVGFPKGGRLPLQSLVNTRDLGAVMTMDGRHILPRKLLRSGDLYHLSLSDQRILRDEYRLKKVIDFRTNAEIKERPDTVLAGVEYYHIPILDEDKIGITHTSEMDWKFLKEQKNPCEFMERIYENILNDEYSVKQYARFIDVLLHHENGAVLWHGGKGKDRTGIATALLLGALGVSCEIIREDYKKTNLYLEKEKQYMCRFLESCSDLSEQKMENTDVLFRVEENWLNRSFTALEKNYGSVEGFLKKGLYLTPKTQDALKEKYLL